MRRLLRATTVLIVAGSGPVTSALVAAPPPTTQTATRQSPTTGTASILGHVIDATTGSPVDDAVVSLQMSLPDGGTIGGGKPQARPLPTLVNDRGQFVFVNLPAGAVTLRAASPGYLDSGTGVRTAGGDPVALTLADGQHAVDVTIRMWRFASLAGIVADESGDPVADVPVRLLRRAVGDRRVTPDAIARTDDRGLFRFASLEPGRYLVAVQSATTSTPASVVAAFQSQLNESVSPLVRGQTAGAPHPSIPGFRVGDTVLQPSTALAQNAPPPAADGAIEIYRTTFYPVAAELGQAETIDVAAGDDRTDINLTLPLVRTVSISGVVAGADRLLLRLVPVDVDEWIGDDTFVAASTMTDGAGAFAFLGVPPGQYLIEGQTSASWVRARVAVTNAPVTGLSLTSTSPLRVTGRIRFAGSSPVPAIGAGGPAWLTRVGSEGDSTPAFSVTGDGRFSIENCDPGRYAFAVPVLDAPGTSWTAASITANGKDLLAQPFDLESDLADVVITLTDRPAEIAGTVRTAEEPVDAVAFPADYRAASDAGVFRLRTATVAVSSGRFVIRALPAGSYLVAAIPHSDASVWTRHAAAIASQATPVALTEGGRITVDLTPVVIR